MTSFAALSDFDLDLGISDKFNIKIKGPRNSEHHPQGPANKQFKE